MTSYTQSADDDACPPRNSADNTKSIWTLHCPKQTSIRSYFAAPNRSLDRNLNMPNKLAVATSFKKRSRSASTESCPVIKKKQQLYLDLGQKNFAQNTECHVCGMLFVYAEPEDAKRHAAVCQDYINGVPFAFTFENIRVVAKSELLMWDKKTNTKQKQQLHLVEIRPSDNISLRKKVAQVKVIVDQELGFVAEDSSAESSKRTYTSFLAIVKKRVVGMVLAEHIEKAYDLLTPATAFRNETKSPKVISTDILAFALERSTIAHRAVLGIYQMWVHEQFRGLGIASMLVDAARAKMVFGYTVPVHELAFSSPTEWGVRFAQRYNARRCPTKTENQKSYGNSPVKILVYDCH